MSIAKDVVSGNLRVGARLMRNLDDRMPGSVEALKELYPHTGKARIIGVTGNPGSGKSTLVDGLIKRYRARDLRVGVVAVDPSSPFSGGAILGDRIRMQRHALDDGVFIRSLASRGHLGGLSRSTSDIVAVMDAMGYDVVFIETVGVGQAEVDIVEAAHLSVVVAVPGLGDEVQALKAGVLEIADVLCVNKADRQGADRTLQDLNMMVDLSSSERPKPPILATVATTGEGLDELVEHLDRFCENRDREVWQQRVGNRARHQVEDLLREESLRTIRREMGDRLEQMIQQVARRETDPYSLVDQVLEEYLCSGSQDR